MNETAAVPKQNTHEEGLSSSTSPSKPAKVNTVLASAALATATSATANASTKTKDLIYLSATKLAALLRSREVSAVEAVEAFIDRQIEVNDKLNAVVTNCFARARSEAKKLDAQAAKGEFVGPLHGVPMTLKDSLDTAGVVTTGATIGRQTFVPDKDATVVARVRNAGAILLGKTNTPEFTLGGLAGINTASNILFGGSHNPYDLTRSTRGSSGGAGAIVAAGGSAFDIGSDWGGSIRGPAHANGIVGIKPTSVRVPRTGHIVGYGGVFDLWQQIGPMCRRVEDIALITPLISGPDFSDAACAPVPWADPARVDISKLKGAFCQDNGGTGKAATDEEIKVVVRQSVKWLQGTVASIAEDIPLDAITDLNAARSKLISGDGWAFYQRMADKWGSKNFSPRVTERIKNAKPLSSAEYIQAWEQHDLGKSRMLDWMADYDFLICPVAEKVAQPIDAEPDTGYEAKGQGWQYRGIFNSTGWPSVVVRCGSSADGKMPVGLQVIAKPWREDICIALASYLERKGGGWVKSTIV